MSDITADFPRDAHWSGARSGFYLIFGVALPLAALVVELAMRLNADVFFDPLPTVWHVLLVAFVIIANGYCWHVCRFDATPHMRWAALANGVAIGVASVYTVLFLPLMPLGTIFVVYFGLGALVWAPAAALIIALCLRRDLARSVSNSTMLKRTWAGAALGLLALVALDLPVTITRVGVRMAISVSPEERSRGLRMLRAIGSEDALLRMCYVRTGSTTDMMSLLINWSHAVVPEQVRQIYYRVTGRPFNSVPAPTAFRRDRDNLFDWNNTDTDQGGELVGGRVRDLWLASSAIDGSISAEAALGYLEWTMVFRNDSSRQHEARAQIALPPGAVVSRVTLWVNGQEREAAFGGRNQVRQAYQSVVRQNRDPLLVTTAGPDRVSVQLFPVPTGGTMKVRIGMTVPLGLINAHETLLRLPYFNERNFDVRSDLRHAVWIESKSPLQSVLAAPAGANKGTFRAYVDDARLTAADASVIATRGDEDLVWSEDPQSQLHVMRQVIVRDEDADRPQGAVIVVDGSASMEEAAPIIARQLASIPPSVPVKLLFAQDEPDPTSEPRWLTSTDAAKQIAAFDYSGGHDNTMALVKGLELASSQPDTALIWIHGPQPLVLTAELSLHQQLSRGHTPGKWYELQVAPGRNVIAESLDGMVEVETLRTDDLGRLVAGWTSADPRMTVKRERIEFMPDEMPPEARTSDHLARLWANDEVHRLVQGASVQQREEAIETARRYQLVTPVTGAVVLESRQQYTAAGLEPVAEGTVPSIPEPEEWALIIVALGVFGYAYRRRHARIDAHAT